MKFLKYLFRLKPDFSIDGIITDLSIEILKNNNIKGLILDLDNTIIASKAGILDDEIKSWLKQAQNNEIKLIVVSNNNNSTYLKQIEPILKELDIELIGKACKPFSKNLKKAIQILDLPVENICLIGDRVLTDILGGVNLNMKTALVKPLIGDKENIIYKNLRKLEYIFLYKS